MLSFDEYVVQLEGLSSELLTLVLANGALHSVDLKTLSPTLLRPALANAHKCSITRWDQHCLLVADADCLSMLDLRVGTAINKKKSCKQPYSTITCHSSTQRFAVGSSLASSEAIIEIWDIRNDKPIHTYTELHSDDITSLSFSSINPSLLLSASTDGLFSITDCQIAEEDDAVLGVGNVQASLKSATWLKDSHSRNPSVFCLTDMETASLWTSLEPELLKDYGDLRQSCPTPHWKPDYCISANESHDQERGGIDLFLGSKENGMRQFWVDPEQNWHAVNVYQGQHTTGEIIRCALTIGDSVLTGGEDGKLVIWPKTSPSAEDQDIHSMQVVNKKSKKASHRFTPY